MSWPVAARTRSRNSPPLAASRTALVATSAVRCGRCGSVSASSAWMASSPRAMPASPSLGWAWLMPALMRASTVRMKRAVSRPSGARAARSTLIELLPISITATLGADS